MGKKKPRADPDSREQSSVYRYLREILERESGGERVADWLLIGQIGGQSGSTVKSSFSQYRCRYIKKIIFVLYIYYLDLPLAHTFLFFQETVQKRKNAQCRKKENALSKVRLVKKQRVATLVEELL